MKSMRRGVVFVAEDSGVVTIPRILSGASGEPIFYSRNAAEERGGSHNGSLIVQSGVRAPGEDPSAIHLRGRGHLPAPFVDRSAPGDEKLRAPGRGPGCPRPGSAEEDLGALDSVQHSRGSSSARGGGGP